MFTLVTLSGNHSASFSLNQIHNNYVPRQFLSHFVAALRLQLCTR